ncbi:hypothetical protein BC829DRAFT_396768 [Chytridium lagenaria]|nr:hypothetical protein BC829DRAFT_396768 [Chytridium lagenaria]
MVVNANIVKRGMKFNPIMFFMGFPPTLPVIIGASILVGSMLPRPVGLALGIVTLGYPILKVVLEKNGLATNARMNNVAKGGRVPRLMSDDDDEGNGLSAMRRELERSGPEVGYLGGEDYTTLDEGSTTLSVQYWRSVQHLHDYAQDKNKEHYSPWKKMMEACRTNPENGIWHETFMVKDGQYEAIYVNMPATGLSNCREAEVVPAQKGMSTMYKRLKMDKLDKEMPAEFRKDY